MNQLPQIDPVEVALAVIGIEVVISREVETVTKAQFREMESYPKTLQQLARGVCRNTIELVPQSRLNYKKTLKELSAGFDVRQVEQMVDKFPPEHHGIAGAFVMKSKELVEELQKLLPVSVYQTFSSGFKNLDPSDVSLFPFKSVLEVLQDPLRVFSLIATGALLARQVKAVRLVYPSLSEAIDAALEDAAVNEKVERKSYELPPRAEYGVGTWFNRRRKSTPTKSPEKPNAPQSAAQSSTQAKEALSPAQKASGDHI